ncbi:MAG: hypothetical protein KF814_03020 [Nitrospiraceae bacterium]|nr:hypothetical protein [Nitrospiraceae bacterium]
MNCLRCNSPMFRENYDDQLETQGQKFSAMHCLMCGDIVDPVILANRRHRVEPRVERARLAVVTAV